MNKNVLEQRLNVIASNMIVWKDSDQKGIYVNLALGFRGTKKEAIKYATQHNLNGVALLITKKDGTACRKNGEHIFKSLY